MNFAILSTCLSVEEFFTNANWLGIKTPIKKDEREEFTLSLSLRVEEFFSHHNWHGLKETKETKEKEELVITPNVFSLTMTVNDFFQGMVWQGQPSIASQPEKLTQKVASSAYKNLNLTELSKLF